MLPVGLIERLADGEPRPRRALAESLAVTDAELTVELERLAATGLAILEPDAETVRLARAIDWIDPAAVERGLSARTRRAVRRLERALVVESTNRLLLDRDPPPAGSAEVAIAEYQRGGRGRRGRGWTMPPGAGLALSASWRFERSPEALPALSLAAGAAARRAIADAAGIEVGLKWPNDLIVAGRKLGGVLVELGTVADGACHVVAGIGINVSVPAAYLARVSDWRSGAIDLAAAIDLAGAADLAGATDRVGAVDRAGAADLAGATDRAAASAPRTVSRSSLAAALIERLVELFASYEAHGFASYRAEWLAAHVLDGARVELTTPSGVEAGTVRGIETDGALVVENARGARRRFITGDVTLRPAS